VCIDNAEYPSSLELCKIYQRLPDPRAEQDGLIRVIDESGEDYLYSRESFVPLPSPKPSKRSSKEPPDSLGGCRRPPGSCRRKAGQDGDAAWKKPPSSPATSSSSRAEM